MRNQPESLLKRVFGYASFRGPQKEIVEHITMGGDALVLMPTGGGKSICYQIPSLIRQGTGIVVSPLIALMQNQVSALRQLGVRAAFLNSSLRPEESRLITSQLMNGTLDLLYVAPERLCMENFLNLLSKIKIALFAIDEAHCVSQWGHDFRPEYCQLSVLHERFPNVPRLALTATADSITRDEIIQKLKLSQAKSFVSGFDRPNIQYRIHLKNSPRNQLLKFLRDEHPEDAGIVYCLSRKSVESTAEWLSDQGFTALPYHAGLSAAVRERNQQRFLQHEGVIIVATIAFGMGIDKPDVRFVAHLDLPKSVEAYYQETGRAGRDGLPATAWMVYSFSDVVKLRQMIAQSEGGQAFIRLSNQKLNALLGICEAAGCRRQLLLKYFGDTLHQPCGNCDACLIPVDTYDGTVDAQKALSCVVRTGQCFGAGHLIDVLRGISNEKVCRKYHDKLPTYGCGSDKTARQWQSIFRQLVASELLSVDVQGYGGLQLTQDSLSVLKGERTVTFRFDPIVSKEKQKNKQKQISKKFSGILTDDAMEILKRLKKYRMEQALKQNVPAYTVFHNATLEELAVCKPKDFNALGEISGIGAKKLERYGADILELLGMLDNRELY